MQLVFHAGRQDCSQHGTGDALACGMMVQADWQIGVMQLTVYEAPCGTLQAWTPDASFEGTEASSLQAHMKHELQLWIHVSA